MVLLPLICRFILIAVLHLQINEVQGDQHYGDRNTYDASCEYNWPIDIDTSTAETVFPIPPLTLTTGPLAQSVVVNLSLIHI